MKLVDNFEASYSYVANDGPVFSFMTNLHAPRYRCGALGGLRGLGGASYERKTGPSDLPASLSRLLLFPAPLFIPPSRTGAQGHWMGGLGNSGAGP